jgi:release factor glutamine methyltransferase
MEAMILEQLPATEEPLEIRVGRLARWASLPWLYARLPFLKRRIRQTMLERIDGVPLVVLPEVLNPVVFRSGAFLARTVAASPLAAPVGEARVLDMGTGSGVGAIFAARRGFRGIGVDLNPLAVRCARANVLLNGLEERLEIREGNLFKPVAGERFDLILFNPPFYRGDPEGNFDLAWRGTDVFERFAAGLPAALAAGGRALILLSTDGDPGGMLGALTGQGFRLAVAERRHFGSEIMTVYCATREAA